LLPSALTVALLAAVESLLSAVVADGMSGTKHNSNVELLAQGWPSSRRPYFLGNHLKPGHTLSLQNRPTQVIQNKSSYT